MDLSNLQFEARPRNHWEAADLGCLMARRWWPRLAGAWLAGALPVAIVALLLFPRDYVLVSVIVWWFKPLYERLPLIVLGREVFGESPPLRDLLASRHALGAGLLEVLTFRRLSPNRALHAPVWVLEGLRGARGAARRRLLGRSVSTVSPWLTVLGVHVETFLAIALLPLAFILIPSGIDIDWLGLVDDAAVFETRWFVIGTAMAQITIMLAVAPFYVGAGFGLYLNRRIELEAWDIELKFRDIARRSSPSVGAAVCIAGALLLTAPGDARADERAGAANVVPAFEATDVAESPAKLETSNLLETVLAQDDFGRETVIRYPAFLESLFDDPQLDSDPLFSLDSLGQIAAWFVEGGLWFAVVLAAIWIVTRRRPQVGTDRLRPVRLPTFEVAGFRLADQPPPEDVVGAARDLFRNGRRRDAVALLYRCSLVRLIQDCGCEFSPGHTETECVIEAGARAPAEVAAYFSHLTGIWTALAYGHHPMADATFGELCARWPDLFAQPLERQTANASGERPDE